MKASVYSIPGLPRHLRNVDSDKETATRIIRLICDYKKITVEQVMMKGRKRQFVYARQLAMWFIKPNTSFTLEQIGELFRNKDHTTVMYARQKIEDLADAHPEVRNDLENIQLLITYGTNKTESKIPLRQAEG